MSKTERTAAKTEKPGPAQPDEQVINDLMAQRKLQQDALKKIITSMDKSGENRNDANISAPAKTPGSKGHKQDHTKLI
jgi:hypothetical protein